MKIKKKHKILLGLLVVVIIGGIVAYNYVYHDHRDIQSESAKIEISAEKLLERFKNGGAKNLVNETLTISGRVSKVEESAVTLDESVYASFSEANKRPKLNESVRIKGRCIGYDELFGIVKLDQCSLQK